MPTGHELVCEYCETVLWVEPSEIRSLPRPAETPSEVFEEPPVRLWQQSTPRVEVSLIEQLVPEAPPEVFRAEPMPEERLALLYLRIVDHDGKPVRSWDLPEEAVLASLREHGDPGLAANAGLQWLVDRPQGFPHRLQIVVALFDPARAGLVSYTAGCPEALVWLDCENASIATLSAQSQGLDRKMLRGRGDAYFENCRPVLLGPGDALVLLSPGVLGDSACAVFEVLREVLGEDPLRVVTLAKNAFWEKGRRPPVGPVRVAALQPVAAPLAALPPSRLVQFGTARFQLDLWANPLDALEILPLHGERWVLVWASGDGLEIPPETLSQVRSRVLEVLDRRDHGDNENPRVAGRYALEGLNLRLTLVLLVDRYARAHYFTSGWGGAIYLGPRGNGARGGSLQAYDQGGSATLDPGSRLLLLGRLPFARDVHNADSVAEQWPGGKTSRLFALLGEHWKTPPGDRALGLLAQAALSDRPGISPEGMGLVTGKPD